MGVALLCNKEDSVSVAAILTEVFFWSLWVTAGKYWLG